MKRAVVTLALLAACRREATPQPVTPLVTRQEPATATTASTLPSPTPEPPKPATVAPVQRQPLSGRRAAVAMAVDAPEPPAGHPRFRAVDHPSNPDVTNFEGFALSQGETPDTYSFDVIREPEERYPWRWEVRWFAPAADHQSTEGETGAEPVVHVVVNIPAKRPDGEVWMRQGNVRTFRIKVWRDGVLIHDQFGGVGMIELITPHEVTP